MVWITDFGAARLSIILEKLHKLRSDRTFLYSGNFLFTLLADVDLIQIYQSILELSSPMLKKQVKRNISTMASKYLKFYLDIIEVI